jgi:sterol desaturase/sphingolipid hydroxylase (fatty acid hydroxylase superfamily)
MALAIAILAWAMAGIIAAEFLGYGLHRLLHSGRIPWLSRSHMIHHLLLYGPLDPKRPAAEYRNATEGRFALGNVGLEWLIPGSSALLVLGLAFWAMGVSWQHQLVFAVATLLWSFGVFSYLHDRMHQEHFWMARTPLVRRWFLNARKLHDIHHWSLSDDGTMDRNFGIGFFVFDRLFGTRRDRWQVFNQAGYVRAQERFADLLSFELGSHTSREIKTRGRKK